MWNLSLAKSKSGHEGVALINLFEQVVIFFFKKNHQNLFISLMERKHLQSRNLDEALHVVGLALFPIHNVLL